jgi:hypothetical protein
VTSPYGLFPLQWAEQLVDSCCILQAKQNSDYILLGVDKVLLTSASIVYLVATWFTGQFDSIHLKWSSGWRTYECIINTLFSK